MPHLLLGGTLAVTGLASAPVRVAVVDGHSMVPNLRPGQPVLYTPVPKGERVEVSRGELVLIRMGKQLCLKRVFATGGEAFWSFGTPGLPSETHRLIEMNRPIAWWKQRFPKFSFLQTRVPTGSVWVLGDAPCSVDSRHLGPVRMENIVGKVIGGKQDPAVVAACVQAWSELPSRAGHSHGYASSRLPGRPGHGEPLR